MSRNLSPPKQDVLGDESTSSVISKLAGVSPEVGKIGAEFLPSSLETQAGAQAKADAAQTAAALDAATKVSASAVAHVISTGTAYVSPTRGDNATAVIGNPLRPYATVFAALTAANRACIDGEFATLESINIGAANKTIYLSNGATLESQGFVQAVGGGKLSIVGHGHWHLAASFRVISWLSPASFYVDITGDIIVQPNDGQSIEFVGTTNYINARRVMVLGNANRRVFTAFFGAGSLRFGDSMLFHTAGDYIFCVGGPHTVPSIILGANSMLWSNNAGGCLLADGGSLGGIATNGIHINSGKIMYPPTGAVSIIGAPAQETPWLAESMFLDLPPLV